MTTDTAQLPHRHASETSPRSALAADVHAGLTAPSKTLPPKWFYDAQGSELFEQIALLPEYYPTRRERAVLSTRGGEIASLSRAVSLVELGSGSSEKTRLLLDALSRVGTLQQYVPVDVSESALVQASQAVSAEYPRLDVRGVVADFDDGLETLPGGHDRLVAFLGSTIGNFEPPARRAFLARLAATMHRGDTFLLGTDLVKDERRLVAAYDDAAGVTAQFNLNVLRVINRELDADFDLDSFVHEVRWSPSDSWIEMHLRSVRDQTVRIGALAQDVSFARGETVRTEVSTKFTRQTVETELAAAGMTLLAWWTDRAGDYAVSLAAPAAGLRPNATVPSQTRH